MSPAPIEAVPLGADLLAASPRFTVIHPPEPDDLTWHQADDLTAKIRRALRDLTEAVEDFTALVERAWASRADVALRYPSWADYCADIFADVRGVRLPPPTRQAVVHALRASGMSTRAMASAVGIDKKTVMADLRLVQTGPDAPGKVTSLDGRQRPATAPPTPDAPTPRKTDVAVATLTATPDGLTITELARKRRWTYPQASATLCRLEKQGRVTRAGDRREGYSVYRLPT